MELRGKYPSLQCNILEHRRCKLPTCTCSCHLGRKSPTPSSGQDRTSNASAGSTPRSNVPESAWDDYEEEALLASQGMDVYGSLDHSQRGG